MNSRAELVAGLFVDRHLGRRLAGGFNHFVYDAAEIFQTSRGDDDGVAATVDIFGDAEKAAPRVFFQSEEKSLSLDLHFITAQGILDHRGLVRLP